MFSLHATAKPDQNLKVISWKKLSKNLSENVWGIFEKFFYVFFYSYVFYFLRLQRQKLFGSKKEERK
jgi:hypothetical protein